MSFEYTIYTLQLVGNPSRGYQIQSDRKTDKKLETTKSTCGDQDILTLVWNFISEPSMKDILPRGIQVSSALRKHLIVERDPDFDEFLFVKDGRTMMPLLKLEEHEQAISKTVPLNLPTLTQLAQAPEIKAVVPLLETPTPLASDEEVARNRRLVELVAALLKKTISWSSQPEASQHQVAAAMVASALKDENFAQTLEAINTAPLN